MESNENDVRRTVLSVLEQCSVCQCQYELDDARVIERQGELWVLSLSCSNCSAQAFVAAVVDGDDAEVGLFDPAEDEEEPRQADDVVTVDDVLDMHEFLESFDGDFRSLFSRRRRPA